MIASDWPDNFSGILMSCDVTESQKLFGQRGGLRVFNKIVNQRTH